ncbi:MAG TPA: ribonuclease P protein component [Ignavibacteria bacterium]|nr:ribonuclease P protein component [Ignavibacteria bacterium]
MDKSEGQSYDDFSLRKDEIIRGHDSYFRILQDSKTVTSDFLKAFVNKQSSEIKNIDFTKSPLFTHNVKVGFIIAKKKIRKSYFRNRIRRLLKEAYRLNRNIYAVKALNLNILFSLTDKGYLYFKEHSQTKFDFVDIEMKILLKKIINKFTDK